MISDLGSCLRIDPSAKLKSSYAFGGNPKYLAPEVVKGEDFDGLMADIWSIGVMLCGMLFGTDAPFVWASSEDRRFVEICIKGNLKELSNKWDVSNPNKKAKATPVSDEALDLIQNILRANPTDRLSLQQILEHPWVVAEASPPVFSTTSSMGSELVAKKAESAPPGQDNDGPAGHDQGQNGDGKDTNETK